MPENVSLPPRPDLALRLGFAGNREIPDRVLLARAVDDVMRVVIQRMNELAPGEAKPQGITQFYSDKKPTLQIVTGLAEGADELAAEAPKRLEKEPVTFELAAVLPFDWQTYRDSRQPGFQKSFEDLYKSCDWVLELDGRYGPSESDKPYRGKAYRAQATLLLRNCDILVAMADLSQQSKAGGTQETIQAALSFGLPVVLIDSKTGRTDTFEPHDVRAPVNLDRDKPPDYWQQQLRGWVTTIVAGPDIEPMSAGEQAGGAAKLDKASEELLKEYFGQKETPPIESTGTNRSEVWKQFERWFHWDDDRKPPGDPPLPPYETFRKRATTLNYYYVGLYRGAFVLNFVLAVAAVCLAALSLVVLALGGDHPSEFALLILGGIKLVILGAILTNTRQANRERFNDKAIDYRYLAERLRVMYYLPRAGSFQPPAAAPPQFSPRFVRQSAVDWLFDAIVRHVSPGELAAEPEPPLNKPRTIRIPVDTVLEVVLKNLIGGQVTYHDRNEKIMERMNHALEACVGVLTLTVISAVVVDIAIVIVAALPIWSEAAAHRWHLGTLWLVFLATVLPAAIASLNGIRFQSEARRLADRSSVVGKILRAHEAKTKDLKNRLELARANPAMNPGSWAVEVMLRIEACAQDLAEEVADWAVMYARDVPEP